MEFILRQGSQWVSAFRYSGRAEGMTSTSCISIYDQRFNARFRSFATGSNPRVSKLIDQALPSQTTDDRRGNLEVAAGSTTSLSKSKCTSNGKKLSFD